MSISQITSSFHPLLRERRRDGRRKGEKLKEREIKFGKNFSRNIKKVLSLCNKFAMLFLKKMTNASFNSADS